jgi:replicative DNA helicase
MTANFEVEQIVLGTLLADPKCVHFVPMLAMDDFTEDPHRLIFEAIQALASEGRAPSPVVLAPQFQRDKVGEITVAQYLARLVTMRASQHHMPDHVRALKELTARRVLMAMGEQMWHTAGNLAQPVSSFIEQAVATCDEILSGMRRQRISSFSLADLAQESVLRLKDRDEPNLIKTGLAGLDKDMGGFGRGDLIVLAGRPSMGKSTIALSCMRQAARKGVTSLFFSLEMNKKSVADRMLSDAVFNSQTPIHYKHIIRGTVSDWDIGRLEDCAEAMTALPIQIDDQTGLTVSEIGVRAKRHASLLEAQGQRLDAIWIDHLGYLRASDRYRGNRVHEVGEVTKALRSLAKELNCAIILLCQLSRQVEQREDKRPQMSDLRDSGNIEEDADCVLFAYREAYYLGRMSAHDNDQKELERLAKLEILQGIVEIIGDKTRNDSIFSRRFFVDMGSNAVRDLA